jgi:hypothetical protein
MNLFNNLWLMTMVLYIKLMLNNQSHTYFAMLQNNKDIVDKKNQDIK